MSMSLASGRPLTLRRLPSFALNAHRATVKLMTMSPLEDACTAWQSDRDGGSSTIRGAARRLTRTTHYFDAPFIRNFETDADEVTVGRATSLLQALATADRRDSTNWGHALGINSNWVGRGIKAGPQDPEILRSLGVGTLTMALWGMSFDRSVTKSFGERFVFELIGEFPAIPAWIESGIKAEEQELITGGVYNVMALIEESQTTTIVRLEFVSIVPLALE